jgi:hypothetical protein
MKHHTKYLFVTCVAAMLPALAHADILRVEIKGVVDYSVIGGSMAGVASGAPAVMSFNLDSNNFADSANYPTRGYAIDLPSFSMTVGGRPVTMDIPQPGGAQSYFVLRNNDPGVDGFFISPGTETYAPLSVHIPGLNPAHELDFHVTYGNTTTLSSLNILDAVGSYGTANMSVYQWTIGRFGVPGAEYAFNSLTISAVPEPAAVTLLGLGLLVVLRRSAPLRAVQGRRNS